MRPWADVGTEVSGWVDQADMEKPYQKDPSINKCRELGSGGMCPWEMTELWGLGLKNLPFQWFYTCEDMGRESGSPWKENSEHGAQWWFCAQGSGKGDSGHGHSNGRFWAWDTGKGDSRHKAQRRVILVTGYREGRFFCQDLFLCLLKSPNHLTLPSRLLLSTFLHNSSQVPTGVEVRDGWVWLHLLSPVFLFFVLFFPSFIFFKLKHHLVFLKLSVCGKLQVTAGWSDIQSPDIYKS